MKSPVNPVLPEPRPPARAQWTRRAVTAVSLGLIALLLSRCSSPPSVAPLVRVSVTAIEQERAQLAVDATRQTQWYDQQRQSLEAGFAADLGTRPTLDAEWVKQGVQAYVAAREMLVRHELSAARALETRQENLAHAADALRRAVALIEQQDQLFEDVPDLRRWLNDSMQQEDAQ